MRQPFGSRSMTVLLAVLAVVTSVFVTHSTPSSAAGSSRDDLVYAEPDAPLDSNLTIEERYLRSVEALDAPEALTEEDLDHILGLRAAYGLSSDQDFVRSLYESPREHEARRAVTGMLSSIAFSPEEESQVIRRAAAEWVGYKVDTLAVDRVEEYAASVIEPDGSVTVLCAPCNPTDIDHVRRSVEVEEHFVPIDYRDVEYSAEELLTIAETFADKLTRNDISHGGSILSGENRIEIFVSDKDIQRARELVELTRFR